MSRALATGHVRAALAVLALVFALAHLPWLPSTLEDIDSVNFALGVRDFDVARHRPHPPGYPVYIALGKAAVAVTRAVSPNGVRSQIEARALAWLSLLGATVAIVLMYRVLASLSGAGRTLVAPPEPPWNVLDPRALAATALAVTCPLFWYVAARPMSDAPGLAAALAAQGCLALAWWRQQPDVAGDRRLAPELIGASGRMIVLGSLFTALAIGFRTQNAMLTVPLLLAVLADRIGRGVAGAMIGGGIALAVGAAVWAIPLLIASGGPAAYLAALGSQAGEDFAGVQMLYLDPDPRLAAFALLRTFVYPWDSLVLGGIVMALAGVGAVALLLRERRVFWVVAVTAVPYLGFHLAFQDTAFTRYALPLVPSVAYLAVCGLEWFALRAAVPLTGALAVWSMALAMPVLVAYGSEPSPTARVVRAINEAAAPGVPGALAMHQTFQRPLEAEEVAISTRLASPPRREWLELTTYWRQGRTEPLWFLADPRRSDLALVDPQSRRDRVAMAWSFQSLSEIGGMRPLAVTWYRMPAPGWFAEEGWALTPETAGIARLSGRGPHLGPITAWVRRRAEPVRMMIGGRHLGTAHDQPVRFVVTLDESEIARWDTPAGFFLHDVALPEGMLGGTGLARLAVQSSTIGSDRVVESAIEQFDLQSRPTLMWGYDEGWHEAEYDPVLGVWRWTSGRSTLRIVDATTNVRVTIHVEPPSRYFDRLPSVRLRVGDRTLAETSFADSTVLSAIVPLEALRSSNGRVALETNQTFVPAERGATPDYRALGLRVFNVEVTAVP